VRIRTRVDPETKKARGAARAEVKARQEQQLDDGMAQERARQQTVLDKTAKLKAQRLARQEEERRRASDEKPQSNEPNAKP